MNVSRAIVSVAILAIAGVLTVPQAFVAKVPQAPQIETDGQMVILHVRVTDSMGKAVADVKRDSFVVTEDGVPQKIALFLNEEIPLSYGLVIDSSGSLRSQFPDVIRAAQRIVESNRPTDTTFLVRFISSDKIETAEEPTSDKAQLIKTLHEFYIEGGASAVVDAVYLSADKLAKQKDGPDTLRRRVLVLVTDGEDRASFYKAETLFKLLAATDVQIFTIGLTKEVKPESRDKAIKLLTRLGADTGGRTFFPSSSGEIEHISKEIINDIRTQYVVGYVPAGINAVKDFHKVQVSITDNPNQDKRIAITRVGYGKPKGEKSR